MYNPIEVDLYLRQQSSCNLYSSYVGGNPSKLIQSINNKKNKYLEGSYINKTIKQKNKICFEFDDKINNIEDIIGSKYLGKGGLTSVFGLKYLTNNFMPELLEKKLILRAMDMYEFKDMSEFIDKYNNNKILFDSNIIDIYMYGKIFLPNGKFLCSYILTRFYDDHNSIANLDYKQVANYFKSMLEFFVKLENTGYFYRDLKFANIGLDFINETCKFIVLDYDEITLVNKNDDFFNDYNLYGCYEKYCAGTLIPYFIIKDYFEVNPKWIQKFNKLHVIGLVDVMINLFFIKEKNSINVLKILYKPCNYKTCIHYYQYLKIFDDKNIMDSLEYSLINLKSKFVEFENSKKDCLIYLIMNLLNKNYFYINSAKLILEEYTKQIINKKSIVKVPNGEYVNIEDIKFIPLIKSISPPSNIKHTDVGKLNNV